MKNKFQRGSLEAATKAVWAMAIRSSKAWIGHHNINKLRFFSGIIWQNIIKD